MSVRSTSLFSRILAGLALLMSGPVAAGSISLRWDPAPGAEGYRVYYGVAPGAYTNSRDVGLTTQTVVTGLDDCRTYYTAVTAYNAYGESPLSSAISGWARPRILEYTPSVTLDGREVTLRISGHNFQQNAMLELRSNVFSANPVTVESISVLDCHEIEAVLSVDSVPLFLGGHDLSIQVLNGDGGISVPRAFKVMATLPTESASLVMVDSQEPVAGWGYYAIDGDPTTHWHTQWSPNSPPPPHEIQIRLSTPHTLNAFSYLPRQMGATDGSIRDYEFAVSLDGLAWQTLRSGVLVSQLPDRAEKVVEFPPASARFVRLRALSSVGGGPWTSAAEISLAGVPGIAPPSAAIEAPAADLVLQPGAGASFEGMAVPAGGPLPLTFDWSFPACASPISTVDPAPGWVQFDCPPGDYSVTLRVCDRVGLCDTARRRVAVMSAACRPVDSSELVVTYTNSQELLGENGAAMNAIDEDPNTSWVTQWSSAPIAHPHIIQISVGRQRQLCAFAYLPRQDGGVNGTIRDFLFDVGFFLPGWNTVAGGVLVDDAGELGERVVAFPAVSGQRVRLRALAELNGGPWTSAAEIVVYAIDPALEP